MNKDEFYKTKVGVLLSNYERALIDFWRIDLSKTITKERRDILEDKISKAKVELEEMLQSISREYGRLYNDRRLG